MGGFRSLQAQRISAFLTGPFVEGIDDFLSGAPKAAGRVQQAGAFIRDSVGVTGEALGLVPDPSGERRAGGDPVLSKDVPGSQSFGVVEALNILIYGNPVGTTTPGAAEPRRLRADVPPLIETPLDDLNDDQKKFLQDLAVVGSVLLIAPPIVGKGVALGPILVPVMFITLGILTTMLVLYYLAESGLNDASEKIQKARF